MKYRHRLRERMKWSMGVMDEMIFASQCSMLFVSAPASEVMRLVTAHIQKLRFALYVPSRNMIPSSSQHH